MKWMHLTVLNYDHQHATKPHTNEVHPRPANHSRSVCANYQWYQFTRAVRLNLHGGFCSDTPMSWQLTDLIAVRRCPLPLPLTLPSLQYH